jgi:hypothetical protein
MEIENIKLLSLRNEEHYQFHTEFSSLVEEFQPAHLGVEAIFPEYGTKLLLIGQVLSIIHASHHTRKLAESDEIRDNTYQGFKDSVKSFFNHFLLEKREAASRLFLVIENFGNPTLLPYEQETATLTALLSELNGNSAADVQLLGLGDWVTELAANNAGFNQLMQTRVVDNADKPNVNLKETRRAVDELYQNMVKRINALIVVNGEASYAVFVNRLNELIEQYEQLLAIRKGRNEKGGKGEAAKG